MIKSLNSLAIATFLTTALGIKAYGCECPDESLNLNRAIASHNMILTGKFIKTDKQVNNDYFTGRFIIKEIIKGKDIKVGDTLNISSNFNNCSMTFIDKGEYLVFPVVNDNRFLISICSPSGRLGKKNTNITYKRIKEILGQHTSLNSIYNDEITTTNKYTIGGYRSKFHSLNIEYEVDILRSILLSRKVFEPKITSANMGSLLHDINFIKSASYNSF